MRFCSIFSIGILSAIYATPLFAEELALISSAPQGDSLEALIAFTNNEVVKLPQYIADASEFRSKFKEIKNLFSSPPPIPPSPFIKQFRFGISADILYFKPVQDNLKYAETNTVSLDPPGKSLYQKFDYRLGFRVGIEVPIWYDGWMVSGSYMYFHPTMPPAHKRDNAQFLFMTLSQPYYPLVNNFLNIQCGSAKGSWRLRMDVADLALKKAFQISRSFVIDPILGVQASDIRQRIEVHYDEIYIINGSQPIPGNDLPIITPQKVVATSEMWGVGPEIGAQLRFVMPQEFNFFLKTIYSCMVGLFNTTTKYTNLLASTGPYPDIITVPQVGSSIMKESLARAFSVMQLQASISKVWNFKEYSSCEFVIGWETQFWWEQNRFNWYSTTALPSEANLTLQGPFAKFDLRF